MEEEVRQTEEKRTYFDRDRYSALSRAIWRDFGPLIMGALVLLIVLGGGWYLWNRTRTVEQEPTIIVEENGEEVSLPTSEITIPGAASPRPSVVPTSTPSPAPTGTPSGLGAGASTSPKPSSTPAALAQAKGAPQVTAGPAMTKGGKLPQTGLPFAQVALFSLLPGVGFALHKLSKRV